MFFISGVQHFMLQTFILIAVIIEVGAHFYYEELWSSLRGHCTTQGRWGGK